MERTGAMFAIVVLAGATAYADDKRTMRPLTREPAAAARTVPTGERPLRPDDSRDLILSERWRDVPAGQRLKLSQQITDELTELGNFIGSHVNVLSDDVLALKFDGRRRRARLRLGTGEGDYLRFKLDSDWHFTQGKARVHARIDLGLGTHHLRLELPDMEMVPSTYQGQRGVEVRLPLYERRW